MGPVVSVSPQNSLRVPVVPIIRLLAMYKQPNGGTRDGSLPRFLPLPSSRPQIYHHRHRNLSSWGSGGPSSSTIWSGAPHALPPLHRSSLNERHVCGLTFGPPNGLQRMARDLGHENFHTRRDTHSVLVSRLPSQTRWHPIPEHHSEVSRLSGGSSPSGDGWDSFRLIFGDMKGFCETAVNLDRGPPHFLRLVVKPRPALGPQFTNDGNVRDHIEATSPSLPRLSRSRIKARSILWNTRIQLQG